MTWRHTYLLVTPVLSKWSSSGARGRALKRIWIWIWTDIQVYNLTRIGRIGPASDIFYMKIPQSAVMSRCWGVIIGAMV